MILLGGLTAGAVAAIIAALVSLPLNSPLDSAFNSATVAVAAIAVGLIAGLLWTWLAARILWYGIILAGLFVVILVVALAGNTQLDRLASFSIPLAAIIVAVCALLTPMMASLFLRPVLGLLKWLPVIAIAAALALGFGLITQGDSISGELSLPPRLEEPAATVAALVAPSPTPAPTAAPTAAATIPPTAAPTSAAAPTTPATSPPTAAPTSAATPTAPATAAPTDATPQPAPPTANPDAEAQTFIIGEGSQITFEVEEELGRAPIRFDAVISGNELTGEAHLDGQPSIVTLNLHSLTSDQTFRDRYIRDRMFPNTPEAVVTVDRLPDLPQSFYDGEETTGELTGSLQIGDTTTPLLFQVTARHDGDTINILAQTTFTWQQLNIPKPTARSVVYLADEVNVQVLLIARQP